MSASSKKRVQAKRRLEKTKSKNAKKAKYLSFAQAGKEKGSRRAKKAGVAQREPGHPHKVANCGNPGCKACFPKKELV